MLQPSQMADPNQTLSEMCYTTLSTVALRVKIEQHTKNKTFQETYCNIEQNTMSHKSQNITKPLSQFTKLYKQHFLKHDIAQNTTFRINLTVHETQHFSECNISQKCDTS